MASLQDQQQLHFVLVPLMSPGHFIPMLDMAILLAKRNLTVTVISTPGLVSRFTPKVDRAVQSGHRINLLQVEFPAAESGLPRGCETLDDTPSFESMATFFTAIHKMHQPFEELFGSLKPRPSCLIADKHIPWLKDVASKFDTTRIIFDGMGCFTMVIAHILLSPKVHETLPESESESFLVPDLPHIVELTRAQLPAWCYPDNFYTKLLKETERGAYGVIVNSFEELETGYADKHRKLKGENKTWCVGPLSIINEGMLDKAHRGNKAAIDQNICLKWLDQYQPDSVVYACLGSLTRFTLPQLVELGFGLEASNCPFIWVIRKGKGDDEIDKWMKEEGFEERTKGRGLIIRGWAPQVLILSHSAIGAFLTHCGWNSTIEGVCAGVPMITWPNFADQFFNEKLLVNVLEIGASVGAKFAIEVYHEENYGVSVKRDAVREAVEKVMSKGVEGGKRRGRAKSLGEMAKRVTEEGGSSYFNLTLMIDHVIEEINRKDSVKRDSTLEL